MKKIFYVFILLFSSYVFADPALNRVADFTLQPNDRIELYKDNVRSIKWTLRNNTNSIDCTGYQGVFYYFNSTMCKTSSCSWTSISNGIFTATLTTNDTALSGNYTYGVGVSNAVGLTTAQQGILQILDEP